MAVADSEAAGDETISGSGVSRRRPSGWMPCSRHSCFQNSPPIWLPHWPTWRVIISRGIVVRQVNRCGAAVCLTFVSKFSRLPDRRKAIVARAHSPTHSFPTHLSLHRQSLFLPNKVTNPRTRTSKASVKTFGLVVLLLEVRGFWCM